MLTSTIIPTSRRLVGQRGRVLLLVQRNFLDGRVTCGLGLDVCVIGGRHGGVLTALGISGIVRTVGQTRDFNVLC